MKHNLLEKYQDKKGEWYIKTEEGTKTYYRYLVEQYLGFKIPNGYSIHHLNENHSDNRLENFLILPTSLHFYIHRTKGTKNLFESNLEKIKENGYLEELT